MKRALWPMSTARGVALLRAIEMLRPEAERISVDPYARRFVDLLTLHTTRAMISTGLSNALGLEGMMNFAIVRERHVEALMAGEADAGLDQIVILGAGFIWCCAFILRAWPRWYPRSSPPHPGR